MSIKDTPHSHQKNDQPEESGQPGFRISKAAGSMLRRSLGEAPGGAEESQTTQPASDVPISAHERALIEALQAQQPQITARPQQGPRLLSSEPPPPAPDESPFPDLPPELKPQRADGTGSLTLRDIRELDRGNTTTPLITPDEARRADEAIEHLQSKMMVIANEFASGDINQAQFQAIYTRYCEQRAMIERIRTRDPEFKAWQAVASEGATGFLRQQFAAYVVGCGIANNQTGEFIRVFGDFRLDDDLMQSLLVSLQEHPAESLGSRERSTQIQRGRWLSIAPGNYATTIVIFSHEPSAAQREVIADLNRDFERANHRALKIGTINPKLLVYPHRTLFEEQE